MGLSDFVAAEKAKLVRLVPVPTGPLGYGTDLSCVTDVTPGMDEVDPFSTRAVGEALVRRLTTPRGSLPDDPDYGLDLRAYCNAATTGDEINALSGKIRAECRKDDRVYDASPTASFSYATNTLSVALQVTPVDPTSGVFTLTFAVTDGAATLEAITQ